jgi:hypothetical protein
MILLNTHPRLRTALNAKYDRLTLWQSVYLSMSERDNLFIWYLCMYWCSERFLLGIIPAPFGALFVFCLSVGGRGGA